MRKLLPLVLVLFASQVFGESKEIAELRKKAEAGDAAAQNNLGVKYDKGQGALKDQKEAVKWYRKAAAQGNAFAQNNLGYAYGKGEGVPKDDVAAYAWYSLGAFPCQELGAENCEIVAKEMTPEQIAKAQELSKELLKKIEANKAKKK